MDTQKKCAEEEEKREHMDGLNLLSRFVMKFGDRPEFFEISNAIKKFLEWI